MTSQLQFWQAVSGYNGTRFYYMQFFLGTQQDTWREQDTCQGSHVHRLTFPMTAPAVTTMSCKCPYEGTIHKIHSHIYISVQPESNLGIRWNLLWPAVTKNYNCPTNAAAIPSKHIGLSRRWQSLGHSWNSLLWLTGVSACQLMSKLTLHVGPEIFY